MTLNAAERLRSGDRSALAEIITEYTPYVSTIIYNVSNGALSVPDMEETAADVFITLWKNSDKVSGSTLKGYLAAISKSRAKDKLRTLSRRSDITPLEDQEFADEYSLPDTIDNAQLSHDIESSVNKLKEPDREIVIRYYYYYQPIKNIADILGMNTDTVKTKLRRARLKLRELLEERGY